MFSAAQIVRAQWVLFSQAAGVLPDNAGEISQMENQECYEGRIGLAFFSFISWNALQFCSEEVSSIKGPLAVCMLGTWFLENSGSVIF